MQDRGEISVALLCAGGSNRFGAPKLRADLNGRPVWSWAAEVAEAAQSTRKCLVVSPQDEEYFQRDGWTTVINPNSSMGIASSIEVAVGFAKSSVRLLIVPADMPLLEPSHLEKLARADGVAFSLHPDGRAGAPAAFPSSAFERLRSLAGDRGAGAEDWPCAERLAPAEPGISLFDIDTPHDLETVARKLGDH